MAGRPSFRGRMGVEDGAHGEQDRAEASRGSEDVPNTVPMPITARGASAAGDYKNTALGGARKEGHEASGLAGPGIKSTRRGAMANNPQASYNHLPEREGAKGDIMGRAIKSTFYNDVDEADQHDVEDDSGSGPGEYGKKINGFGSGKNTFSEKSNFYNEVGDGQGDGQDNSGTGLITGDRGGGIKAVRGFSSDAGLKSGMI